MAYSVVPTVTTGDLWTANNHNTYVRDNFRVSVPDIFATKGDIVAATGADASVVVSPTYQNQKLASWSVASGGVQFDTDPIIVSYSFTTSTEYNGTALPQNILNDFTTKIYDTHPSYGAPGYSINPFVAPYDGYYIFGIVVLAAKDNPSVDSRVSLSAYLNTVSIGAIAEDWYQYNSTGYKYIGLVGQRVINLSTDDEIELYLSTSGTSFVQIYQDVSYYYIMRLQ